MEKWGVKKIFSTGKLNGADSTKDKLEKFASDAISAVKSPREEKSRRILPTVVAVGMAFLVGLIFDGAVGLVLGIVAGMIVMKFFGNLKIPYKHPKLLISFLLQPVSRTMILLGLLLPFGKGLTLATGHYPDTLLKYLSLVITLPQNLLATSGRNWWFGIPDYYPGAPLIVSISIVLMFLGALMINKKKYLKIFAAGLVLYTISPTLSYLISTGRLAAMFYSGFYTVGFYLTWAGFVIFLASKYLQKSLKVNSLASIKPTAFKIPSLRRSSGLSTLTSTVSLAAALSFGLDALVSYFGAPLHLAGQIDFDFELLHHSIASVFSGGAAAVGAWGFVSGTDWSYVEQGLQESTEASEGQSEEYGSKAETLGPIPSTDPNDPPGTMIAKNPDGTIVKTMPDGTKGTLYGDGTVHIEQPDGTTYTEYPDGTSKTYMPDGTVSTEYPDGRIETKSPDGKTVTSNPDGTETALLPDGKTITLKPNGEVTITYPDGTSETIDEKGELISVTSKQGFTYTKYNDKSLLVTSKNGGSGVLDLERGVFKGTVTSSDGKTITGDGNGNYVVADKEGIVNINRDGSSSGRFSDGSWFEASPDGGFKGEKEGYYFNATQDGKLYAKNSKGEEAIFNPDGSTEIKFKDCNIHVNPDGSGSVELGDKSRMDFNADGSGRVLTPEGFDMTLDSQGNATGVLPDGSTFNFNKKDESMTIVKPSGETATYNHEQIRELKEGKDLSR